MESIAKMKSSGILQLTRRQMLMHFFWGFFICFLTVFAFLTANSSGAQVTPGAQYIVLILGAMACFYIFRQLRSLRFTIIKVSMDEAAFRKMFEAIAKDMDWIMEFSADDCIIATTEFRWTNWGTLITIVHDKDRILVNSICDLYKRPSTFSWGQNRKNVQAVKQYISQHYKMQN